MKTFDLDIFQLIILLGSIQGLVFAAIIFIRKKFRLKSNVFLGLMIVFIALSNIQHILIDMNYLANNNVIRKLYLPIQWFIMPMFYLHIHELFKDRKLSLNRKVITFLPIVIVFCIHVIHFILNSKTMSVFNMPDYYTPGLLQNSNLISFIFNGLIFYFIYRLLIGIKKEGKKSKELKWYSRVTISFLIIASIGLAITFIVSIQNLNHKIITSSFLLLVSLVGYYLGYVAVFKSISKDRLVPKKKPPSAIGLNTFEKVSGYIIEERRYLNQEINLTEIASNFNLSTGYLSQLFNTHSEHNFNDYINKLRIEASKKMLLEKQFENYTIESIGLECGFKSKSNFYSAFKKFTGVTPKLFAKT